MIHFLLAVIVGLIRGVLFRRNNFQELIDMNLAMMFQRELVEKMARAKNENRWENDLNVTNLGHR